ncbi:hypothetical protein WMF30_10560 [Sorangium sp. So ce134]
MPRRPASQDWPGSPASALSLLRAELSFLRAVPARLSGAAVERTAAHAFWLDRIPGDYARKLGVLCAAAPAELRERVKAAFSEVLSPEDAATMRGVADGTEYAFEVELRGAPGFYPADEVTLDSAGGDGVRRLAYCRRVPADRESAQALREQIEREAYAAGAELVRVTVRAA